MREVWVQGIIDWKIKRDSSEEHAARWWDGKPFRYDYVATDSKAAFFASVGCRYPGKS